jgi:alpha-glucosidase (family GH31 glycosyl hydrolase)
MKFTYLFLAVLISMQVSNAQKALDTYRKHSFSEKELVVETEDGYRVKIRPYTNQMIRLQYSLPGENFFDDRHYDIILSHEILGSISMKETKDELIVETSSKDGLTIKIRKNPVTITFYTKGNELLLSQKKGVVWEGSRIRDDFEVPVGQRFLGFGQAPLGYQNYIELTDKRLSRNYGEDGIPGRGAQGNLLVPFFMSSKGYGLYLNSTFPNDFSFGKDGAFFMGFDTKEGHGQMDYFFIKGTGFDDVLKKYVDLTGRPRLIPKSMFGLQLSDNDPRINNQPIDQEWWETMVSEHQDAGFPIDHAVFDNDWRPGVTPDKDGQWGGSKFEYNYERFPDPSDFKRFLKNRGVTLTLDLNLNNCNDSWGWEEAFNLPVSPCSDSNSDSYPDYTKPEVRNWVWELFWEKALNPALDYPCDGLWIDESDGVWSSCVPDSVIVGNGRTWGEMRNYYYFLMGKAIVEEGWSNTNRKNHIGDAKRPYVWIRGGSSGGQRFGTHWTGDIHFTQEAYETQIKSLQVSGLSAYPYFNHDAGGFVDDVEGPNDHYYIQWAMAFGSFTPIWRPHGYGKPRWPLNRSQASQDAARKYGELRYEMMPYIYSMAHVANQTGMPMARAMSFMFPNEEMAWRHELQYMWGDEMLVAPGLNLEGRDSLQNIWLPAGTDWHYMWNNRKYEGGQILEFNVKFGEIPVFIKSGAIVPKRAFAVSTSKLSDEHLILDIYGGADGSYTLYEDDGVSDYFLTKRELRVTEIDYFDSGSVVVHPAMGSYDDSPVSRSYLLRIHNFKNIKNVKSVRINGENVKFSKSTDSDSDVEFVSKENDVLLIHTFKYSVDDKLEIRFQ